MHPLKYQPSHYGKAVRPHRDETPLFLRGRNVWALNGEHGGDNDRGKRSVFASRGGRF